MERAPWWWLLGATAVAWFIAHGFRLVQRSRLRGLPLVRPLPFLLGHLACFRRRPLYLQYAEWMRQYGNIFLIFLGKDPVVVLSDPELIREVGVRHFKSFHDRPGFITFPNSKDKRITAIRSGLLVACGGYWASLRAAMSPLFHTQALQSYSPIMNEALGRLLGRLQEVAVPAAEGAEGQAVNLHGMLGQMTMQVIGRSAFGIDFSSSPEQMEADRKAGIPSVVAAAHLIFNGSFTAAPGASGAGILLRVLPRWMEPVVFTLFFRLLGRVSKNLEYVRSSMLSTADLLMQGAKKAAEARGEEVKMDSTDWRWWGKEWVERNPYRGVTPAPNSVINMLMRATNKETGAGLTDVQIGAQCSTLLAAGYETTANALAFTVYCLATHPEEQARLLAEIDAFGRDKEVGYEDLERFPFLSAVINESLRLYPPAYMAPREATEDCMIGGRYLIPRGTWVHFNIWGMHHNEAYWPEPEEFRPQRFLDPKEAASRHPNAHLPFGLGPRNCIGWRFAMEELHIALVRLYQQLEFVLSEQHEQVSLQLRMGITLAPKDGLWVRVLSREK